MPAMFPRLRLFKCGPPTFADPGVYIVGIEGSGCPWWCWAWLCWFCGWWLCDRWFGMLCALPEYFISVLIPIMLEPTVVWSPPVLRLPEYPVVSLCIPTFPWFWCVLLPC